MRVVAYQGIAHLPIGGVGIVQIPAGSEVVAASLDPNTHEPRVIYVGDSMAMLESRQFVMVMAWNSLPDLPLRWIGSCQTQGWQEFHLFEVQL